MSDHLTNDSLASQLKLRLSKYCHYRRLRKPRQSQMTIKQFKRVIKAHTINEQIIITSEFAKRVMIEVK